MQRFFIDPANIQPGGVVFPKDLSHQICRVLRLKAGDRVAVLDNLGRQYQVELSAVENHHVEGKILSEAEAPPEPKVKLFLYLCLSQREKFEWMLQKCAELGAAGFIPVVSGRSLVQDIEDKSGRRTERWQSILREAAEQSGRGRVPRLEAAMLFQNAVEKAARVHSLVLLPTLEAPERTGLTEAFAGLPAQEPKDIAVCIGPEGGFSAEETLQALAAGCKPVSLGPRVLRMETAAVAVTTLIMHAFGEMG